jgi:hypothetical protein
MIGEHTVVAYTDPNAAGWGFPMFSNSYFDTDLTGWATGPFDEPWIWASQSIYLSSPTGNGSSFNRTEAATISRPANVAAYRIRIAVNLSRPADVFVYLFFGKTRIGAAVGPFWRPAESTEQWGAYSLPAGQSTFEVVFDQSRPGYNPGPEYIYLGSACLVLHDTDNVPFTAHVSSLETHYRTVGDAVDLSCLVDQVSIAHGRGDPSGQPEASSATIDFTATRDEPLPPQVDIGSVVVVSTLTPEGGSTRFTGRVTDIALGWDDAGVETPDAGVGQIIAVSVLADLGRRVVGSEPWPVELDGARISRVADLAGMPLDARWSDPGTVSILARDVDAQQALDVMHGVAESAGGIVWDTRDGDVRYADADHRRGIAPSLVLDACDVLVTPRWLRNLAGLVNRISIGYGLAPDGGEQPQLVAEDTASITKYGRYGLSVTTELAALADAQAMSQLVIVRNSSPVWNMNALPVDVESLSQDETTALLSLDMHALVTLTGLPAIGSAPTSANLWVEGWTERLAAGVHEFEMYVSGYCRTSPPPRWDDLDPTWTWNTAPADLTWNDTTCLGPPTDTGRWADVPSSLRWDDLTTTTWDQWTTTPDVLATAPIPITVGG